jgi:hypothetical protein
MEGLVEMGALRTSSKSSVGLFVHRHMLIVNKWIGPHLNEVDPIVLKHQGSPAVYAMFWTALKHFVSWP